jgi:hypothetical protein
VDVKQALELAYDAMCEIDAMDKIANELAQSQQDAIAKSQLIKQQSRSLAIPAVGDIKARWKAYMQSAYHFAQCMLKIIRLFYPEKQDLNWDEFQALVEDRYGKSDQFYSFAILAVPKLKEVQNGRDCLVHKNENAVARDFELEADGAIAPPTIEFKFRTSHLDRVSASDYMRFTVQDLLAAFELVVTHLCNKNLKPFAGFPIRVGVLSENFQKSMHVRYAYGTYDAEGNFVPMG